MGLSIIEIDFLGRLIGSGKILKGGDTLEFGQSQTVGDPIALLNRIRARLESDAAELAEQKIGETQQSKADHQRRYGPARAIYRAIFDHVEYQSIDLSPGPRILWADLNLPLDLKRRFKTCINNGTSEHVFNQANVFKAMHDHTAVDGLMIHWTPTVGWINHGIFNLQAASVFDLATANAYQIESVELGARDVFQALRSRDAITDAVKAHPRLASSLLCFALRRKTEAPFVMPMQGQAAHYDPVAERFSNLFPQLFDREPFPRNADNLALNKPANQSSTSRFSFSDDPKVDANGANNGMITGLYGFHTDLEDNPWWAVDLTEIKEVSEIRLFNRIDLSNLAARASRLQVMSSLDGDEWSAIATFREPVLFGGADGSPLSVTLKEPVRTRFIRIELLDRNFLHLDEVEVY